MTQHSWEVDVVYARLSEWKFRIVYVRAWTSTKLVLGLSTKNCLTNRAWCSDDSYSAITKICLLAFLHLNPQLLPCKTYFTPVRLISLGFPIGGEPGRNVHYNFLVLLPTLHSLGIVNGPCHLVGGSALAWPSKFCHSGTRPHNILSNTFCVFNQPIKHFTPSLSLELWSLVFVFIFFVCYGHCAIRWQSHLARGALVISGSAQRVTASMDHVIGSIYW